jgi:ABC-type nitrate/sulfonate/bicarbonate transport system substrate-binding protein
MTNLYSGGRTSPAMSRRGFLAVGGLSGVGAALALAGCGSSSSKTTSSSGNAAPSGSSSGSPTPGSLGTLSYAFSWLYDVTQAGPYIADTKGYYTDAGFKAVNFIPGGPSAVPVLTQLVNGKAEFGVSGAPEVATANNAGASIRILGAMYQKTPLCIMSLAASAIKDPKAMKGKRIGVADGDKPALLAFLELNGLKASDMSLVPYQYDPTPLIKKQIDGFVGYSTQDPITLSESGTDAYTMNFSAFGYQTVTQLYVATTDRIAKSRDEIKGALLADIRGWRANIAEPAEGATLAVTKYGKSLKYSQENQLAADQAGVALMKTPDTVANGILTVTDELQAQTVKTLGLSGIKSTAASLFDLSLLSEVYASNPTLKTLS